MGDNQNHFNNNQTHDNITIVTLNHNVQNNGTDSQENPIKNNSSGKRIWSEREIEIDSNRHKRKTERIWIHGKTKEKMG